MLPTFTGNSKRPRNVNLSGQRSTNPWAASPWSGTSSGTSKTIAQAQIEREKRQKERDELAAAKRLQRVWRASQDRAATRRRRRTEFDTMCAPATPQFHIDRALALFLAFFDSREDDDLDRLNILVQKLGHHRTQDSREDRIAPLLVKALERRPDGSNRTVLRLLVQKVQSSPGSIHSVLNSYFELISRLFDMISPDDPDRGLLIQAISAPLSTENGQPIIAAYHAFAFNFLSKPNTSILQQNPAGIASIVDLQALSQSVAQEAPAKVHSEDISKDDLLWLLAHFIALNRATPTSQGSAFLEALYFQLSALADEIRIRTNPPNEGHDDVSMEDEGTGVAKDLGPLPPYVMSQLDFLVNEDGISQLLSRFTSTASSSARLSEEASFLAGYTLILLRCFPSYGDDIKMRLFQGDISTSGSGGFSTLPSVKYFWKAASATGVFAIISANHHHASVSTIKPLLEAQPIQDQEWRTVLLFLELYSFLLRVTDDEDFLQSDSQASSHPSLSTSRIRASGLDIEAVKRLANFLKNVCYPLYHDLPTLVPEVTQPARLSRTMGMDSGSSRAFDAAKNEAPIFAGIMGLDIYSLRRIATTTMHSLYERDSRRSFLPKDFWLMTSKFDIHGFIAAVVLEEQQKADIADEEEDEDEELSMSPRLSSFSSAATSRLSRAARIEKHRQIRRVQRENMLAQAAPKLELLRNMPFIIPFDVRVQIFRQFVHLDKSKRRNGFVDPDQWRMWMMAGPGGFADHPGGARNTIGRHMARVKRGQVFEDAYDGFYPLGDGLKEPIQITFVDQFDQPEAGIDGGGVTKEFLTTVTNEAFAPNHEGPDFFVTNKQNLLYPNPTAFDEQAELLKYHGFREGSMEWVNGMQDLAKRYEFLGRLVGKCMYEGILLDLSFSGFFLLKWSSSGQSTPNDFRANLNDLRDQDPELYQGLISLKNYPGDVSDLSLDFTITDQIKMPSGKVRTVTRPLKKNGENLAVTNKDRPLYISYVANHRLVAQPVRQTKAFLRGLGSIINPSWLSMFNQSELQRLVGGDSSEIDVEDLRRNTLYSGVYSVGDDGIEHPTIQLFWQVMHSMQDSERRDVIKYVTSTPRAPLLGFSQLSPQFSIRDSGNDEDRLPSTSTCVNLLKLPRYTSAETLKTKLLYAVQSGAGFDLS